MSQSAILCNGPYQVMASDVQVAPRIPSIALADLIVFSKSPGNLLIDIRPQEYYIKKHLPNAINIPPNTELEIIISQWKRQLLSSSNVIVYGISLTDSNSRRMAEKLQQIGVQSIYIYCDGIQQWINCDLPTETLDE